MQEVALGLEKNRKDIEKEQQAGGSKAPTLTEKSENCLLVVRTQPEPVS